MRKAEVMVMLFVDDDLESGCNFSNLKICTLVLDAICKKFIAFYLIMIEI